MVDKLTSVIGDPKCDTCPKLKQQTADLKTKMKQWAANIENSSSKYCRASSKFIHEITDYIDIMEQSEQPLSTSEQLEGYKELLKMFGHSHIADECLHGMVPAAQIIAQMNRCPCKN